MSRLMSDATRSCYEDIETELINRPPLATGGTTCAVVHPRGRSGSAPRGLAGALPPAPWLYRLEVLRHAHGLAIAEGPLQFYYHTAVGIH